MPSVVDPYATPSDYRTVLGKSDAGSDADVATDLLAVSRYVDRCLGRFFTKDAAPVARVFTVPGALRAGWAVTSVPVGWAESENPHRYGLWARVLPVDDLAAAPTSVVVDQDQNGLFADAPLAATDYEPWPLNADKGPEPQPWTALAIPSWSTLGGWQVAMRVQVTAQWGWPAVPPAIARATIHLTGILRLESPRATSRVNEMGDVLATSKPAQDIVHDLKRQYVRHASVV